MLTLKALLRSEKYRKTYGEREGSCFGVQDSTRLREDNYGGPYQKQVDCDNAPFEEGQKCFFSDDTKGFYIVYFVDRELINGYKARVSTKFRGSEDSIEDWVKDKAKFSDLKTREEQYIYKLFLD
jgi:hypothetical protein